MAVRGGSGGGSRAAARATAAAAAAAGGAAYAAGGMLTAPPTVCAIVGAAVVSDLASVLAAHSLKRGPDGRQVVVHYVYHEACVWELPIHVRLQCVRGTEVPTRDVTLGTELLYFDRNDLIVSPSGVHFDDGEYCGGGADIERRLLDGSNGDDDAGDSGDGGRPARHTVDPRGRVVEILRGSARNVIDNDGDTIQVSKLRALPPGAVFYHTLALRFHVKSCWYRDSAFRLRLYADGSGGNAVLPPFVVPGAAVYVKAKPATTPRGYAKAVTSLAAEIKSGARAMAAALDHVSMEYPTEAPSAAAAAAAAAATATAAAAGSSSRRPVVTSRSSSSSNSSSGGGGGGGGEGGVPLWRTATSGSGGGGGGGGRGRPRATPSGDAGGEAGAFLRQGDAMRTSSVYSTGGGGGSSSRRGSSVGGFGGGAAAAAAAAAARGASAVSSYSPTLESALPAAHYDAVVLPTSSVMSNGRPRRGTSLARGHSLDPTPDEEFMEAASAAALLPGLRPKTPEVPQELPPGSVYPLHMLSGAATSGGSLLHALSLVHSVGGRRGTLVPAPTISGGGGGGSAAPVATASGFRPHPAFAPPTRSHSNGTAASAVAPRRPGGGSGGDSDGPAAGIKRARRE